METPPREVEKILGAFVTGSQAYGTATPDSDIDLVCLVSEETKQQLIELAGGLPIRFGKLNLILETSTTKILAWWEAMAFCKESSKWRSSKGLPPLTRDEAVSIHNDFGIGLDDIGMSGLERDTFSDDY